MTPDPGRWWWQSHVMTPTLERLDGSLLRIYFSGRNSANQSHIGWVVVDLDEPTKVVDRADQPVLSPGELGCFDDNGVTPASVVVRGEVTHLYYIGWNPGSTVRLHLYGGLALGRGGEFERWSRAPILERTKVDPFLNTAPYVLHDEDGWRMWYCGGVGWVHRDLPRYNIRLARSDDGLSWRRDGTVCIDFASEDEHALARPFVLRDGGLHRMWFAAKGEGDYRIGYAESEDGVTWVRDDAFGGLQPGAPGSFDDTMVEYAAVVEHRGQLLMFYNGNDYGRGGIGLAVQA